jgi:hypothetical protein
MRYTGVSPLPLEPSRDLGADTGMVLRERLGWDDERIARSVPMVKPPTSAK